jgi:N-acetylmuramoyl-L-alanine amidase
MPYYPAMLAKDYTSPNFNDRDPKIALDYIVLHYTNMKDAESALNRLCDPASQVSAHYVIGEDGHLWPLVDESLRAWHAGESFWRGIGDMNSASIGIELVNPGHSIGYRPFPDLQIAALKTFIRQIVARRGMSPTTALLAHSDIAPARKQDPGALFPWQSLAQEGLGIWPDPTPQDFASADEDDISEKLGFIGYDTSNFSAAVLAFQRRFYPENLTGKADPETAAKIRALRRLTT